MLNVSNLRRPGASAWGTLLVFEYVTSVSVTGPSRHHDTEGTRVPRFSMRVQILLQIIQGAIAIPPWKSMYQPARCFASFSDT